MPLLDDFRLKHITAPLNKVGEAVIVEIQNFFEAESLSPGFFPSIYRYYGELISF